MKKTYLLLNLLLTLSFCYSQKKEIDSIPFSLEKQLLTFNGKLNGKDVEFAFDTGAAVSLSNSINNKIANVEILDSGRTINDSSRKKIKLNNTKIESISVGKFEVKNIKGVTFDMPFLYCNNLLLLGQDFIKKFNWKIDFNKKLIYISKAPFKTDDTYKKWDVYYNSNRPLIDFSINNKTFKNCLLDTGFAGIMEINSKEIEIVNKIFDEKKSQNQVNEFISTNMGASGLGKPEPFNTFFLDEIKLDQITINQLPITINKTTDTKIGINFFNQFSDVLIMNFNENSFYLKPSNKKILPKTRMDAKAIFIDGHLTVISKNMNDNSTAKNLIIGEKIKSINGKKASEFSDCEMMKWAYFSTENYIAEKENGEKVEIKSSSNLK